MKKLYALLFMFFFVLPISSSLAQDFVSEKPITAKQNIPGIPYNGNVEWGTDLLVSASEPEGKHSGVYRNSNGTIYVSVPDVNIQAGAGIVILSSTNNGTSWTNIAAIQPDFIYSKTKMIRTSLDSIYCFFQYGATVYCWNVFTSNVIQVKSTSGYRDFDVAASSTGSMYMFFDSLGTNSIIRYSSSDGGFNWGLRGNVTTAGAFPRVSFSGLGDTLSLNYYGPVLADTATSIIRHARYRETAPATMATVGAFIDITRSIALKKEFSTVRYGNNVWFIYTSEEAGNVDIRCKISTNSGVSFVDSTIIGSMPGRNESWFDAKYYSKGNGGVSLIFYSDSAQAGPPTNSSDYMNYTSAPSGSPLSFIPPVKFSEHPPVQSAVNYFPVFIPYYNATGDAGAVWVGADGATNKVYFDKLASALNLTVNLEACSPVRDTVTVTVRSNVSPYEIIESAKAYLSVSGTAQLILLNVGNNKNYYIMVTHRNSIETWSKSGGEIFINGSLTYNFTTAAAQAFGSNMVNVGGKWSFYTGDVTQDGVVDGADGALIDNDAFNFVNGYVPTDLNCDTIVDGSDASYADNNSANFVSVVRP